MEFDFEDLLKILKVYELKNVTRATANNYICSHTNQNINRKETTAEHVYSTLKLIDFFFETYPKQFENLNKFKMYELILYHDDVEIETGDIGVSDTVARKNKEENELKAIKILSQKYPKKLQQKLLDLDNEFRYKQSKEAEIAHLIEKLDAIIDQIKYPNSWGKKKKFSEEQTRQYYEHTFKKNDFFNQIFEEILTYLREHNYFEE